MKLQVLRQLIERTRWDWIRADLRQGFQSEFGIVAHLLLLCSWLFRVGRHFRSLLLRQWLVGGECQCGAEIAGDVKR